MIAGWLRLGLFAVPSYAAEVVGHVDGDTVAMRARSGRRGIWSSRGFWCGCVA